MVVSSEPLARLKSHVEKKNRSFFIAQGNVKGKTKGIEFHFHCTAKGIIEPVTMRNYLLFQRLQPRRKRKSHNNSVDLISKRKVSTFVVWGSYSSRMILYYVGIEKIKILFSSSKIVKNSNISKNKGKFFSRLNTKPYFWRLKSFLYNDLLKSAVQFLRFK